MENKCTVGAFGRQHNFASMIQCKFMYELKCKYVFLKNQTIIQLHLSSILLIQSGHNYIKG